MEEQASALAVGLVVHTKFEQLHSEFDMPQLLFVLPLPVWSSRWSVNCKWAQLVVDLRTASLALAHTPLEQTMCQCCGFTASKSSGRAGWRVRRDEVRHHSKAIAVPKFSFLFHYICVS